MATTGCKLSSHVELLTQQPPRLRRPLPSGRLYHFTVIYNHAQSSLSQTEDTQLARAWTELAVEWLQLQGLVNTYYHDRDCPQGQGLVKELSRVLAASEVILLLLTPSFVRDCLPRYCLLKSFNTLFTPSSSRDPASERKSSSSLTRVIPVALGLVVEDLPALIKPSDVVCFRQDFQQDIEAWGHLTSFILSAFPAEGSMRGDYFGRPNAEPGVMSPSLLPEAGGSRSDSHANGSELGKQIDSKFCSSHIPEKDSSDNTGASGYRSKLPLFSPQRDDGDSFNSPQAHGHVRQTDPNSQKAACADGAAGERQDFADSGKIKASETARSSSEQNIFTPSREEKKKMSHMAHTRWESAPYEFSRQVETKHSKTQRSSTVRSSQARSPVQEIENNDWSDSGSVSQRAWQEYRHEGKPVWDTEQASYSNSRELYFRHGSSSSAIDVTGRREHDVGGERFEKPRHPLDDRQEEHRLEDCHDHRLGDSRQHKQNFLITRQNKATKVESLRHRKDEFRTHRQEECLEYRLEDVKMQAQEDSMAPPQESFLEHKQNDSQAQRQEVPKKQEDYREQRQENFQEQRQEESLDRKQKVPLVQGLEDSPEHRCEGFLTHRQEDATKHRRVDSQEHRQEDTQTQRQEVSQVQGQEDSLVQGLEDSPEHRHEGFLTHKQQDAVEHRQEDVLEHRQEDVLEHRQEDPQTQRREVSQVERREDRIEQKREDFQVQREDEPLEHRHDSYLTNRQETSLKFSHIDSMQHRQEDSLIQKEAESIQHKKAHSEAQSQGDSFDRRKDVFWTEGQKDFSEHTQEDSCARGAYSLEHREKDSQPQRQDDLQVQRKEDFQPQRQEDFQPQGHEEFWVQRQTDSHPQSQEAAQPLRPEGFQPQKQEDVQMQRPEDPQSKKREDFKQHEASWGTASESTITRQENVEQGKDYKFQSTEGIHDEFAEGTPPDQCRTTQVTLDDVTLTFRKPLTVDIESAVLDRLESAGIKREIWDSLHMVSMANANKDAADVCSPGEDDVGGNTKGDQSSLAVGVLGDEASQSLVDDSHDLDLSSRALDDTEPEGSACVELLSCGIDNVIKKNMESEQFVSINLNNVSRNHSLQSSSSSQSTSPDGRQLQSFEKILHSDTSISNEHLHDVHDVTFFDTAAAMNADECSATTAEKDKQCAAKSVRDTVGDVWTEMMTVAEYEEEKPSDEDVKHIKDELDAGKMDEDINTAAAEIGSFSDEDVELDSVSLLDAWGQHFSTVEMGKEERIALEVDKSRLSDAETKKVKSGTEAGEESELVPEDAGNGKLSTPRDTKEFEKNTWSDNRCAAEDEEGILTTAEADKGKLSSADVEKGKTNAADDEKGKLNEPEVEKSKFSTPNVEEGKVSAADNRKVKLEDDKGRINTEDTENGKFTAHRDNTKFEKNPQRDKLCAIEDCRGILHATEVENGKLSAAEHEEHILSVLEDENGTNSATKDEEDKLNAIEDEAGKPNGAEDGKGDYRAGKDEVGNMNVAELEKSKSNGLVVEKGKPDAADVEEEKVSVLENEGGVRSAIEVSETNLSAAESHEIKVYAPKDEESKQNDAEAEKGKLIAVKEEDKLNTAKDEESRLNSVETENDRLSAVKDEEGKLNGAESEQGSLGGVAANAAEGSLPVYVAVRSCEDSFHSDFFSASQTDLDALSPRSDRDSGFASCLHPSPSLAIDETVSFDWYLLNGVTSPPETPNDNFNDASAVTTSDVLGVISIGTMTMPSSDFDHTDSKESHSKTTSGLTPELSGLLSFAAVGKTQTGLTDEANSEDASTKIEPTSILPGPDTIGSDRRELRTFVEDATQTSQLSFEDLAAGADTLTSTAHFDDIDNTLQSLKEQLPNKDTHQKWTLGQMLLPLYRVMVYMLTRPELPYT